MAKKILLQGSMAIMKKLVGLLFLVGILQTLSAQGPSQFRYQAAARDAVGAVITGNIDTYLSR